MARKQLDSLVGLEAEFFINSRLNVQKGEGKLYSPNKKSIYDSLERLGGIRNKRYNVDFLEGSIGNDTSDSAYVYEINTNPEQELTKTIQGLIILAQNLKLVSLEEFKFLKGWSIHFNYSEEDPKSVYRLLRELGSYSAFSTKTGGEFRERLHIQLDFPRKVEEWKNIYETYSILRTLHQQINKKNIARVVMKTLNPLMKCADPALITNTYLLELTALNKEKMLEELKEQPKN